MLIAVATFAFSLLCVSACFAIETWLEARSGRQAADTDPGAKPRAVENAGS